MSLSTTWTPQFEKIDLLALYITMYLKRIVINKLPWKEHLDILYNEVKANLAKLGKKKEQYLVPTLKDFGRIYCDQWSIKDVGLEIGLRTYQTLLLVLTLRLGIDKVWVPHPFYFCENILVEGFLSQKPKLNLVYLSQADILFDHLVPLCPDLSHVSMPVTDNAMFIKIVSIRNLRILEFSSGVSDKVLCHSLWNMDKKSEEVLQWAVKERKDQQTEWLSLPHLEVLRSNIQNTVQGAGSMKLTLGAAALVLQPKLRLVENKRFWSTFQAVQTLRDMEKKRNTTSQRQLLVDRLVFKSEQTKREDFREHVSPVLEVCPFVWDVVLLQRSPEFRFLKRPLLVLDLLLGIKKLSFDATSLSERELQDLLAHLRGNIHHLTLKISPSLIDRFRPVIGNETWTVRVIPSLKSLSLILCEDEKPRSFENGSVPTNMLSFYSLFCHIRTLKIFNALAVDPRFVIYECIGLALAAIDKLDHLMLNGFSMFVPTKMCKFTLKANDIHFQYLVSEFFEDAIFEVLRNLESFEIDELFLSCGIDRLLELLRACNVHVKILDRPLSLKGADPSKYLQCDEIEALFPTS